MTVYVVEWSNWATSAVQAVTLSLETAKEWCKTDFKGRLVWWTSGESVKANPRRGEEYTITPWEVG